MKITKPIANLIFSLEYIIGNCCYNPNAYNQNTDVDGSEYRYPLTVQSGNGQTLGSMSERKTREIATLQENDNPRFVVDHISYQFGSNELYIGAGLRQTLEHLEKRYGLNFNQLEQEYQSKHRKSREKVN